MTETGTIKVEEAARCLDRKRRVGAHSYKRSPDRLFAACLFGLLLASPVRAGNLSLPANALQAMDKIYADDPDAAIPIARSLQQAQPDHPLGYLLEAEALWWKRYCTACEIKYGMVEAWKQGKQPEDKVYLGITDKEISAAQSKLAKFETAEMHVYAGMGYDLEARIYALRSENRNVARVGVKGRAEMLRALELDPQMADATAVLGIYNYYVDTLSPIVKLLRVFMGIPGGNKENGVKQLQVGMNQGVLMAVDARFILARALRQYDQKYEQALSTAEPLGVRYPHNPIFLLLLGNLNAELGRDARAEQYFRSALQSQVPDSVCAARIREIANSFLLSLHQHSSIEPAVPEMARAPAVAPDSRGLFQKLLGVRLLAVSC
jgi:tetratricopeptide (TPR) repeat protein